MYTGKRGKLSTRLPKARKSSLAPISLLYTRIDIDLGEERSGRGGGRRERGECWRRAGEGGRTRAAHSAHRCHALHYANSGKALHSAARRGGILLTARRSTRLALASFISSLGAAETRLATRLNSTRTRRRKFNAMPPSFAHCGTRARAKSSAGCCFCFGRPS